MGLCAPEDRPAVTGAATEYMKICNQHGLAPEQIVQACIALAATAIKREAEGDLTYALELVDRFAISLKSGVKWNHHSLER